MASLSGALAEIAGAWIDGRGDVLIVSFKEL